MSKDLLIIKLGGAAITDKNKPFTARYDAIRSIILQLKQIELPYIIIHGAGSYAHILAKDYKVVNGFVSELSQDFQMSGVSKIRASMQRLHQIIIDEAEKQNINMFSLPISSTMVTSGQTEEELFIKPYRRALELGFVPISYGDMTLDTTESGFIVVSGDRIIKLLAEHFDEYNIRVIFGSDVDGLFNKDPSKYSDATLIEHIEINNIKKWLNVAGESAGIDVTGGMTGKLLQIDEISRYVKRIDLINLTVDGRLLDVLQSDDAISTTFV